MVKLAQITHGRQKDGARAGTNAGDALEQRAFLGECPIDNALLLKFKLLEMNIQLSDRLSQEAPTAAIQ